MIQTTRFDNGVTILSQQRAQQRIGAVGLWIVNGSRHQRAHQSGYAHFLEHVLFKGTARLSAVALAHAFEAMGGQVNAHTGRELTALHGLVPVERAAELVSLFCDMLLAPRFDERDVEIEKDVVTQEMAMIEDNPEELLEEIGVAATWRDHPVGWPILGTPESLESLTAQTVRDYLQDILKGKRIFVVTDGGIDHQEIVQAMRPLERLAAGSTPAVTAPQYYAVRLHKRYGISQTCMMWTMPSLTISDPRYYALVIANHILGGGGSSRLFQEVRERRGLVYGIQSHLELYSDCGMWSIHTACEPANGEKCQQTVTTTTQRLAETGPTPEEMLLSKEYLRSNLLLEEQNLEGSMERLANELIYFGAPLPLEEKLARLDAVGAADVRALLSEAWTQVGYHEISPE